MLRRCGAVLSVVPHSCAWLDRGLRSLWHRRGKWPGAEVAPRMHRRMGDQRQDDWVEPAAGSIVRRHCYGSCARAARSQMPASGSSFHSLRVSACALASRSRSSARRDECDVGRRTRWCYGLAAVPINRSPVTAVVARIAWRVLPSQPV